MGRNLTGDLSDQVFAPKEHILTVMWRQRAARHVGIASQFSTLRCGRQFRLGDSHSQFDFATHGLTRQGARRPVQF